MFRKKICILFVIIIGIIIGFILLPIYLKRHIEKQYNVSIRDVKFTGLSITFNEVVVDSKVKLIDYAKFDSISINSLFGPIEVNGGKVHITLLFPSAEHNLVKEERFLPKRTFLIKDIDVVADIKNHIVNIHDVEYNSAAGDASFKYASTIINGHEITINNGRLNRSSMILNANQILVDWPNIDLKLKLVNPIAFNMVSLSIFDQTALISEFDAGSVSGSQMIASTDDKNIILAINKLKINNSLMYEEPVTFNAIVAEYNRSLNSINAKSGSVSVNVDIVGKSISGQAECNAWAESMPVPRPKAIESTIGYYKGELSFNVSLNPIKLSIKNNCSFVCSKPPIRDLFASGFQYTAYDQRGKPFIRLLRDDWAGLGAISTDLVSAIITLEDGSFYSHSGILPFALQMSLADNLKLGSFRRGGSTITMQLAKNIWLNRNKSILRKSQEILLALILESCLTKDQIIEYYLNAIEFGPNIYGINAAAKYYFDKDPVDLNIDESFYLAMILPHPNKGLKPGNGGLERARKLRMSLDKLNLDKVEVEYDE